MARRRTEEWGIEFSISAHSRGYEWRTPMPHEAAHGAAPVLAPAGEVREAGRGALAFVPQRVRKVRRGRGEIRRAYLAFRVLARKLTEAERREKREVSPEGRTLIWSPLTPVVSEKERRQAVVEFANKYGALWGDDDLRSLADWTREAATFLDLDDVSRAICTPQLGTFEERTVVRDDGFGVRYWSGRYASVMLTIAMPGESIEERAAINALESNITDFYARARNGTPRERAHMLLARQINRKLAGGLSLRASMLSPRPPTVAPRRLVHALYVRMWLDTLHLENEERERICANPDCEHVLRGTRRQKYCSNRCRDTENNRRRAALR